MDLYVAVGAPSGKPIPSQNTAAIIQLSELLRKLSVYPPERQGEKYRKRKVRSFRSASGHR